MKKSILYAVGVSIVALAVVVFRQNASDHERLKKDEVPSIPIESNRSVIPTPEIDPAPSVSIEHEKNKSPQDLPNTHQKAAVAESSQNPFVVSSAELQEDLKAATDKILQTQLGLQLPASARSFNNPRPGELLVNPKDAINLIEDMTRVLRNTGPYKKAARFNPDKWDDVMISNAKGMPLGEGVGYKDGGYKTIMFAPKKIIKSDVLPAYEIRINPVNGYIRVMLSSFD